MPPVRPERSEGSDEARPIRFRSSSARRWVRGSEANLFPVRPERSEGSDCIELVRLPRTACAAGQSLILLRQEKQPKEGDPDD